MRFVVSLFVVLSALAATRGFCELGSLEVVPPSSSGVFTGKTSADSSVASAVPAAEARAGVPASPVHADFDLGDSKVANPQPNSHDQARITSADVRPARPVVRAPTPAFEATQNILVAGVDRSASPLSGRTDTLVVGVFDDSSGHAGVISIPRDLRVNVPGHGHARINATLRIAKRLEVPPLVLLRRVVSDTLAMPIHHALVVDLSAFERVVDAMDGITVEVPCPIEDDFIDRRTETGRRHLFVDAGRQHLDGVTAAMYVRSRHGRSDFSRARRQQSVALALRDRLLEGQTLLRLPSLLKSLEGSVVTDLSPLDLLGLSRRLSNIEADRLHGLVLDHRYVDAAVGDKGQWMLAPDFEAIDAGLAGLFESPAPGARPKHAKCKAVDAALAPRRPRVVESEG